MAENKTDVSAPEKVSGSFVQVPVAQAPAPAPKELTLPEMLTRIYEVEVFATKTLKDIAELLTTVLANQNKPSVQALLASASVPVQSDGSKISKIISALSEFKNEKGGPALSVMANDAEGFYIVKTTGFLGSATFAKVARLIKADFNGEYISQGKASHFRISKA
jgi:hypothetical protein